MLQKHNWASPQIEANLFFIDKYEENVKIGPTSEEKGFIVKLWWNVISPETEKEAVHHDSRSIRSK